MTIASFWLAGHAPLGFMTSSSSKSSRKRAPTQASPAGPEQAQNVWLAGLGALAKAQTEGTKAFDSLVQQGLALQNQTQALAKAQFAEAAQRMEAMAATARPLVPERWSALDGIFDKRVAGALTRLGIPDAVAMERLEARVTALEQALAQQHATPDTGQDRPVTKKPSASAKRAR